ncbi:hypothetical protein A5707_22815 [Mycobacterium kyorinense]|uniref:Mammalian cell entry protein n=1 Tax=Mycobacterium kyorinense TaxID=487514 RepID=A0A1A2Z8Q4_9MYCO|nr:hypothetical protein [Mycobacterium kyorinense]OBI46038.1 hypothetical protein A5707_22815 [Mycobacterium kyorinense]
MPDGEQTEPTAADDAPAEPSGGPLFSAYGIASAVLGALSVAAIVLGVLIWSAHRSDLDERRYQTRVLQTAADWTGVLINMHTDNVDASLQRLHDGTVGQLNVDFDSAMQPYRQVVQKLQTRSVGQIEAIAIESVRHDPDVQPGTRRPAEPLPAGMARRTDSVMVVATSVSENAGAKPQIVHWSLRLGVSDVDGKLLVSRLESIR